MSVVTTNKDYLTMLNMISEVAIIAYTDKKGAITYANSRFCEISGYSFEELQGQNHRLLNSGYHDKEFFKNMYQTIKAGLVWRGEVRNKRKDGTFYWVDSQIFPIYDSAGIISGYASLRFDVTERKQLEDSLMRMEKYASLGEMAAVVAHEINNPLAVISMAARSLKNDFERESIENPGIKDKLDKINKAVGKITKIVGGLKTISRKGENEPFTNMDLAKFIDEAISFSTVKCKQESVEFRVKSVPPLKVDCRPDQISQILLNLINNAQDAVRSLNEKWIEVSFKVHHDRNLYRIIITDSGNGIHPDVAAKMLSPFFTTKEPGKGTGIGLSVSSAIAAEHGGKLYYDPTVPNTTFVLELPIEQDLYKENDKTAA